MRLWIENAVSLHARRPILWREWFICARSLVTRRKYYLPSSVLSAQAWQSHKLFNKPSFDTPIGWVPRGPDQQAISKRWLCQQSPLCGKTLLSVAGRCCLDLLLECFGFSLLLVAHCLSSALPCLTECWPRVSAWPCSQTHALEWEGEQMLSLGNSLAITGDFPRDFP